MLGKDVIQNFKEGSPEAFENIYALFHKQIFAYCLRYTLSRENAEELTHDIFLHLWKTRNYIDPNIGIKGYVSKVSKNIVYTWLRDASRNKKMKAELEAHFLNEQEEILPEKRIDAAHDLTALQSTLKCLPPKRRLVFEMIRFKEMTYNEVADQLSISRDAVKDHMIKANQVVKAIKENKAYLDYINLFYFLLLPLLF